MSLVADKYKTLTASELCADPFFQEWVFHPLGCNQQFWLELLIGHSQISYQMQLAQHRLLQFSKECTLIGNTIETYTKMKEVLQRETDIETCYGITQDKWNEIRDQLIIYEFDKSEHEIQFFKVIKPLFTGEKEFLSLYHHAELFSGADDNFWRRQPQRLEKFKNENEDFIKKYTTGDTRYDEWWFCRGEHRDKTERDGQLASYLGLLRYLQIVNIHLISHE